MKNFGRWLAQLLLPMGGPGVFLVALVDSGMIPIPQGVDILLFAQVVYRPGAALLLAMLATAGSLLGCMFLYYIARQGGHPALQRHASAERIEHIRAKIEKYEALTLLLPTMVPLPIPMKLFIIAAGVFEVHFFRFAAAVLVGRLVRYGGIALVAHYYGAQTWAFLHEHAVIVALGTAALLGIFYWFTRRVPAAPAEI